MSLINTIISQRSWEQVRDAVAAILTVEIANQSAMAYDDGIAAKIFTERWRPVTVDECRDVPVVNVSVASVSPDNSTAIDRDDTIILLVDVYKSAPANQTKGSDELGLLSCQRMTAIIDGILSHPVYLTLGFSYASIMRSKVTDIQFADSNRMESGGISMGRLTLTVVAGQDEPTATGQPIAGILTQVLVNETDEGYQYIYEP